MEKSQLEIPFRCTLHPKEELKRVCTSPSCSSVLLCIECILSSHDQTHSPQIETIQSFIQNTTKLLNSIRRVKSNKTSPPESISKLLSTEAQSIELIAAQIQRKKESIEETMNTLINTLIATCDKIKLDLFKQLDNQIPIIHKTFGILGREVEKFYNLSDANDAEVLSEDIIISQLNAAPTYDQFESIFTDLKSELIKNITLKNVVDKVSYIEEEIKQNAETFEARLQDIFTRDSILITQSQLEIQTSFESLLKEFVSKQFDPSAIFADTSLIALHSNIAVQPSDLGWLRQIIKGKSFKLLFRSSKDGMTAASFHKACGTIKPTLILIKTAGGKIIGGYSDQDWVPTNTAKASKENFLFSISDKKVAKIKNTNSGTHGCNCCLVNFGSGEFCVKTGGSGTMNASKNYDFDTVTPKQFVGMDAPWTVTEFEAYQIC